MKWLACFLFVLLPLTASAQPWQAGSARISITPDEPIWMAGYGGRDHPAEGKLTDLWAKSLVLQDAAGHTAVLITLDLVGIHRDTATKICDQIGKKHNLSRDQIAINCSHTHTGPAVGANLGPLHYVQVPEEQKQQLDDYEQQLIEKIVSIVDSSFESLQPSWLTWGNGRCSVAVNRRDNVQNDVPALRVQGKLNGPSDHDVPVLLVRDADQKLRTVVFGYACHATVLGIYQWSGDYPGYAQIEVEERYPEAIAMFWAGCGADQNPLPRRTIELAQQYGKRLGTAVAEVIEGFVHPVASSLQTSYTELDLPLVDVPTVEEVIQTRETTTNKFERGRAEYILGRLGDAKTLDETYPYPVASWKIGDDIRMVFLGGEVVVDYALRLKSTAAGTPEDSASMIWVAGYSNDVMAYIPSRRVLNEGGYEGGGSNVYYGIPGLWSEKIENMIAGEVAKQLAAPKPEPAETSSK
ncbi:Neutral/alkaline non-lysosomal ceramidase [Rosistilla carotiformis]|uniref:Neutral/alkaline non-lysosomal ceramidase n=1 Tax=Rosistilla carotiformis TaxID=2528017 RepID=A0A518JP74_9BACT|nr:neutral/alkaline non-lysosomal ceramidase N-terminal domain-containing protein [Rosistilla carotiformis]QDV67318.1 Neutral/alkaline non-lysosomal ceramidase [Rosistilla carotiformis]